MTKLNVTTRPIMKTINAAFYDKYTGHFTKAKKHTYNYTTMDDALIEGDATTTMHDMADQLNESVERVKYRRMILIKAKVIQPKQIGKRLRKIMHLEKAKADIEAQIKALS
tara:strand:- start:1165 stop:1497 length:333 start_codon:yes stop_codon:yes gene_type:complete